MMLSINCTVLILRGDWLTAGRVDSQARISLHQILTSMGNLLYLIAVILVIAWAIGFLGYHAGGIIHILLVIAIIAILLRVIRRAD